LRIALTGHRPNKLGGYNYNAPLNRELAKILRELIENQLYSNEEVTIITGMALGADTIWALTALDMQKDFPNRIKLICVIPCLDHAEKMFNESRNIYNTILSKADKVEYVTKRNYTINCMQRRNEYMVDNCDKLIAVWNGTSGGTLNCINYAIHSQKYRKLPILYINPLLIKAEMK
jgi:uncharacterized phage-like protein YoqJ